VHTEEKGGGDRVRAGPRPTNREPEQDSGPRMLGQESPKLGAIPSSRGGPSHPGKVAQEWSAEGALAQE
jgi:hypothetical protein